MPRANSSLPVPVSPTSKTVTLRLVATWVANAITSRSAALSPITWESQRSAEASCDRAEIVTPYLCRSKQNDVPSAECEFGANAGFWRIRRLFSQTRRGGPKSPVFQRLRVGRESLVARRGGPPPGGGGRVSLGRERSKQGVDLGSFVAGIESLEGLSRLSPGKTGIRRVPQGLGRLAKLPKHLRLKKPVLQNLGLANSNPKGTDARAECASLTLDSGSALQRSGHCKMVAAIARQLQGEGAGVFRLVQP